MTSERADSFSDVQCIGLRFQPHRNFGAGTQVLRRKQRAHRMAKKYGNQRDWERFKRLQAELQKSTQKAHRNLTEDVAC